jgi:hypothetical protein
MHKDLVHEALSKPDLYCSCVLLLLSDNLGPEIGEWEPESIYTELHSQFGVEVDKLLADKINASLTIVGTDLYHKSLEAFTSLNTVLNFKYADFKTFNPNTMEDIIWGVTEARLLEGGKDFDAQGFSHDIARYTALVLSGEGLTKPPTILKFAEFDPGELDNRDMALSADPLIATTYWQRNDETMNVLNTYTVAKLRTLFQQLQTLPLKHGENVSQKVESALTNMKE